jgi:hypothetical protein
MRYRLMATYRGAPYEAGVGPADGAVVLFAACPPPEELGFEPATGHWRKELRLQDVQAVWQSRPVGIFRGDRCIVLDDLGDRLHIGYLGHDAYRAEELGYWQVDRGVFELVAARDEVTDIVEERADYPGAAATGSYPVPLPVTGDYGRAAPHSGPQAAAGPAPRTGPHPVSPGLGAAGGPGLLSGAGPASGAYSGAGARPGPDAFSGAGTGRGTYGGPEAVAGGSGTGTGPVYPSPAGRAGPGRGPRSESSVTLPPPPASGTPLPLEAEAMRAASASSSSRRDGLPARDLAAGPDLGRGARGRDAFAGPPARDVLAPAPSRDALGGPAGRDPLGGRSGHDTLAAPGSRDALAPSPAGAATAPVNPVPPGGFLPSASSVPAAGPLTMHPAPVAPAAAGPPPWAVPPPAPAPSPAPSSRRRRSARTRTATEQIFSDLAGLAAIPASSYSVGEEVDGAMCLLETGSGFEVFSCSGGARHEVRVFSDEESACFYLFGVLAAEAVRTGALAPGPGRGAASAFAGDGLPRR